MPERIKQFYDDHKIEIFLGTMTVVLAVSEAIIINAMMNGNGYTSADVSINDEGRSIITVHHKNQKNVMCFSKPPPKK